MANGLKKVSRKNKIEKKIIKFRNRENLKMPIKRAYVQHQNDQDQSIT